ncbi:MAG: dehydrogenase subunit 4 [Bacteroidota bacterium]|jgi:proton-translocating NADH-quinone oxidoreductase chain M
MFFLTLLLLTLLTGIFLICFFSTQINFLKITRIVCNLCLIFVVLEYIRYDFSTYDCILDQTFLSDSLSFYLLTSYNFIGIDSFSFLLVGLTCFLLSSCALFISINNQYSKLLALCLLTLGFLLISCFIVKDIILFYIIFEAILIPMYILIGLWGSRERKIRAVYLLFFYTLISSLMFLVGILYLYHNFNTANFSWLTFFCKNYLEPSEQHVLWFLFFLSFASKIPIFPLHIWLPEAHVEAPTIGSVLLAGILLKLGVYGLLRFNLSFFSEISLYYSPLIYVLCVFGILYASLSAIRQTDFKRIIAYSSVAHMNLVVIGLFSFNIFGIEGAIFQSLSHGFVSGSLFFLVGFLYERYHSRFLYYYGGLVHFMPVYAIFLLFFTLANIALPGTSSFVGEFLLLLGSFKISVILGTLATLGVILCGAYSLWLYNKIIFGNVKTDYLKLFSDLNSKEIFILLASAFLVLILGIYPSALLNLCSPISFLFFNF